jgi:type II secretory pathway component GspD/PulD (secretin)
MKKQKSCICQKKSYVGIASLPTPTPPSEKREQGVVNKFLYILLPVSFFIAVFNINSAFAVQDIQSAQEIKENVVKQITDAKRSFKNYDEPQTLTGGVAKELIDLNSDLALFPTDKKINLVLDQIDVASVLKIIADESKQNIVLDNSVRGIVSNVNLKNVSLNEAFKLILTNNELEARIEKGIIFVASRKAMAAKGLNRRYVKVFKLNNANAVDVAQILDASIFNKGYKIKEDNAVKSAATTARTAAGTNTVSQQNQTTAASNALGAGSSTGETKISQDKTVRGKVEEIDPGDGFSSAKILASEIKIQGIKTTTKNVSVANNDGGATVVPDSRTNSVLVSGLQQDILLAQKTIEYLDKPLDQVAIEVSLIEISKEDTKNLGISTNGNNSIVDGGFNNAVGNTRQSLGADTNQSYWAYNTSPSASGITSSNMYIMLNALIQNKKAKLLANPTIVALDGSESLIKITDQVVSKMDICVTTNTSNYSVTMADVGIVLNILPKIGSDGYVTMKIRPSITSALTERNVGNSGGFVTPISTREVIIQDSRVKSGETLALAGLIKDNELETVGKIPYLSSLPICGKLFQSKVHKNLKTELVILITPKILDNKSTRI